MRKALLLAVLGLIGAGLAQANTCPVFEAMGGYNYVRVTTSVKTSSTGGKTTFTANMNGWNAEGVVDATCWLGIVAQVGGVYYSQTVSGTTGHFHVYPYVFGPRINLRNSTPITPFVEALFGGAHATLSAPGLGSTSQNAFAGAFGGGLDLRAGNHLSVRLIEVDDVLTKFGRNSQNNARISAGIVFHFGQH